MQEQRTVPVPDRASAPVSGREKLEQQLKQLITLSIGLEFEEKGKLIKKLSELSEEKLEQLKQVFEEEQQHKQELLSEFFAKNPQLYQDFERFSQEHVNSIYHEVEQGELESEKNAMDELLQTSF